MQFLRNAHLLARFVLVWFALSIGVAVASPIVQPKAMELICSGAGVMKLIVITDEGSSGLAGAMLDCPLCANLGGPPPPLANSAIEPAHPLSDVRRNVPSSHIAALAAAPLPARGPPHAL